MDQLIREAITEKKLIEFHYKGHHRIAEPHVYGRKGGVDQLLVYQVRGESSSGGLPEWRRVNLPDVSGLRILDETFSGRKLTPSGEHSTWDHIYECVEN